MAGIHFNWSAGQKTCAWGVLHSEGKVPERTCAEADLPKGVWIPFKPACNRCLFVILLSSYGAKIGPFIVQIVQGSLFVSHITSYICRLIKQLQLHQPHSWCLFSQPRSSTPGYMKASSPCWPTHHKEAHTTNPFTSHLIALISTQPLFQSVSFLNLEKHNLNKPVRVFFPQRLVCLAI